MIALFRKEIREHTLSRKGILIFLVISILYSALAFSFISVKELSLLAQVDVNMTFTKMMIGVSILGSIIMGSTLFTAEKEQGTLESLLLTPISKLQITLAKMMGIVLFWLILSLISLPYFMALTFGTNLFSTILLYVFFVGSLLVLSFAGLSLAFSALVSSTKSAMLLSIIVFLFTVIPMFLSTTTKKSGFAYFVEKISPVSSSMLAMKDMLVNKLGVAAILWDILPIFVFFVIITMGLVFASKNVKFLEGE